MKNPIEHFCDPEKYPTPFTQAGFTWATDGKIALRVPFKKKWDERGFPNMPQLFETSFVDRNWKPMPKPPVESLHICNCAVCPMVCSHCGKEIRCKTCFGTGKTGHPNMDFHISERVAISLYYAHALTSLFPGIEFALNVNPWEAVSLRWPGGIGLLMPLRPGTIKPH